ncbi:MAG: nucleoside deaminase [Candidatus Omnitrophica bacterium]|nr:nucleoside deaminase [Candidatus Omnitrophota bacterium]
MKRKIDPKFMMLAIKEAGRNLKKPDGGPFGACIVKNGNVIAVGRNTVLRNDASCHAEINAIREASKKLKTYDLSGCEIYSTTEPCPMCFSAIHWARIDAVVFGTGISDARKIGFNELGISAKKMKKMGGSGISITAGFMLEECRGLFAAWERSPFKKVY